MRNPFEKERLINEEINTLTSQIFSLWDRDNEGVVFSDDILSASGVEEAEFGIALARILGDDSGQIYKEQLKIVLKTLLYGRIEDKVSLFVKFMIRDSSGNISFETIQSYLKISTQQKILQKLGLVDEKGNQIKEYLQYEDILDLFISSSSSSSTSISPNLRDRTLAGTEAINIFCNQILRILTKNIRRKKTMSILLPLEEDHDSPMLWCGNCGDFFKNLQFFFSPPRLYMFFLICLQIFLWIYNFHYYHSHDHPITFCIAKGFGLNLRILTLYLYFTMARSTLNMLSYVPYIKPLLFPGYNISIHSFIGFFTLFHSFGHTMMHIIYQMEYRANGFSQAFYQKSLLKLIFHGKYNEYNETVLSGDGITGLILLVMIILMSFTALMRGLSSTWYSVFTRVHFLYFFWLLFITLHVPLLWQYFVFITILLVLDRFYDYLFLTIHSSLTFSRPCNNGVTFLSIPYSQYNFTHSIGSYYRIQIPYLSSLEWHPFSLAGSKTSHHLSFFIASSGDWTSELYQLVKNPSNRKIKVKVQGPYYAPAKDALSNPSATVLLVASGIGITPFFSVIATKVTDEYVHESDRELYHNLFEESEALNPDEDLSTATTAFDSFLQIDRSSLYSSRAEVQTLHLVWTIRDAMELMFYLDYVYHLVKNQKHLRKPVVKVDVYLTGLGRRTDPEYMIAQTFFLLSVSNKLSDHLTIHFGRPNMKKYLENLCPDEVYYCGGEAFKESVRTICYEKHIPFHSESFDTADSSIIKQLSVMWNTNDGMRSKQSFATSRGKRYDSVSTGYSYSKKHSSIFQ